MQELLNKLNILSKASSKENYPVYAQYVKSEDGKMITCNNKAYVEIEYEAPFQGSTNIYVLQSILRKCIDSGVEIDLSVDDDNIVIRAGREKHTLQIIPDLDFPELTIENLKNYIVVDDNFKERLNLASKFVGRDTLSMVYVDKDAMLATDSHRIFCWDNFKTDIVKPLSVNKTVLNFINSNIDLVRMMSDNKNNIVVTFEDGLGIFVSDNIDFYPKDRLLTNMDESSETTSSLCNIAGLTFAADKVMPIFFGEEVYFMEIYNKEKKLRVRARSGINGESDVVFDSDIDDEFTMNINPNYLKNIPISYDVFVDPLNPDKLYLNDGDYSDILLAGANV